MSGKIKGWSDQIARDQAFLRAAIPFALGFLLFASDAKGWLNASWSAAVAVGVVGGVLAAISARWGAAGFLTYMVVARLVWIGLRNWFR